MDLDNLIQQLARRSKPGTAFAALAGLQRAPRSAKHATWPMQGEPVPAPLRRRALMGRIRLNADRFRLDELLETMLQANGFRNLGEVPDDDIERLEEWLEAHVERLQNHCSDPAAPPAD
jgi:hypothetical protein